MKINSKVFAIPILTAIYIINHYKPDAEHKYIYYSFMTKSNLITLTYLIHELSAFYNTNSYILHLTNGQIPSVHMVTN